MSHSGPNCFIKLFSKVASSNHAEGQVIFDEHNLLVEGLAQNV